MEPVTNLEFNAQNVVLEKFLAHLLVKTMVHDYHSDLQSMKHNQEVSSSFELRNYKPFGWSMKGSNCGC
jgi:hypothetical protein